MSEGISRRLVLHGMAASALATGLVSSAAPSATAAPTRGAIDWAEFDTAVEAAFHELRMVGGTVAVVSADAVLHTKTLGFRGIRGRKPVTAETAFRFGSLTKSFTAALVATYVDDGTLGWDQKVIDAWSGFRAPTDELTRSLRVRDLLGMGTGLGDYPAVVAGMHFGDFTAAQLLRSVVNLPIVASKVDEKYFYNNTLMAVGGYLPLLATGTAAADLQSAYSAAMQERILDPAGMSGARLLDDPRGVLDNYADGHGLDLRARPATVAFAPIGAYAPAGQMMGDIAGLAAWVRLQLRRGRSVTGRQVVSEANLTECWKPHVAEPLANANNPDAISFGYGMGWESTDFKYGTRRISHNGSFDGFLGWAAFFPDHDLGLAVLNASAAPTGAVWDLYVQDWLLAQRFGLGVGAPQTDLDAGTEALTEVKDVGRQSRAVDLKSVEPWLGYYQGGWSLVRAGQKVSLNRGPRVLPLNVMPDGSYVVAAGAWVTMSVRLDREADGTPNLELVGYEKVRRTTG